MPQPKDVVPESVLFARGSSVSCLRSVTEGIDAADPQHVLLSMRNNAPGIVYRGTPDWTLVSVGATPGRREESSNP